VRPSQSTSTAARRSTCLFLSSGHPAAYRLLLGCLACALAPASLCAQTTAQPKTKQAAPDTRPLARFVPKDNLVFYLEFAGVDSHSAAWTETACYKLLNDTALGPMIEEVSGQLLDKALALVPNHKLTGAEIVTLTKHAFHSGWVLAVNIDPKGPEHSRGTFVLRGATAKDLRPISSRLLGWMMGKDAKPRPEAKLGRQLVVLPATGSTEASGAFDHGWVWWSEQDDLVFGLFSPTSADAIIATLDGKSPSAIDHPIVKELAKPDGKFEPVCIAFADAANCPEAPAKLAQRLGALKSEWGIDRVDARWGFDGTALMTVARLSAPKPRKPALAIFDGKTFEKASLLPMPDGVESFVELSVNPSQLLETIKKLAPGDEVESQIEEITESIRAAGQIDFQKDLLAHLGPKIVGYVTSGRSAATNDDSVDSALSKGFSLTAAVAALQSHFPKLTVVAQVNHPEAFGKALEAAVIAINHELKAQAIEKATEERDAADKKTADAPGAARNAGARAGGGAGGDRTKPRRSLQQTPAPRFMLSPSTGDSRTFTLSTPSGSPLKFGPSSFRPTILFDSDYVAFGVSPDAARTALTAVRRKDWKPSASLEKAFENLPEKLTMFGVTDTSDSLASLLASLPGTLQTLVNTQIAMRKGKAAADKPAASAGAAAPGNTMSQAPGAAAGRRGGRAAGAPVPGVSGSAGQSAPGRAGGLGPGGGFGNPTPGSSPGDSSSNSDSMLVLKFDADKLPKSSDLKAQLFASTCAISSSESEIRFTLREAFPNLSIPVDLAPMAAMIPGFQSLVDRLLPGAVAGAAEAAAADGAAAKTGGATGSPAGGQPATSKAAPAGAPGGGRRGRPSPRAD
jgi:hypothetical protein